MFVYTICAAILLSMTAYSELMVRPAGWLDRLVQYHKQRFIQDLVKEVPFKIKVELKPAPPGYKDSPAWNYSAVMRLLRLVAASGDPDAKQVMRRALAPVRHSRRMSRFETFKHFPRLYNHKDHDFYFYYDVESDFSFEDDTDKNGKKPRPIDDDDVLFISNPVEARLPGAHISVGQLKEILTKRAEAAHVIPTLMPRTTRKVTRVTTAQPTNHTTAEVTTEDNNAGNQTSSDASSDNPTGSTIPGGST